MTPQVIVLNVTKGPHAGQQLRFPEIGTLLIGRGANADFQIADDTTLSRAHCRLEIQPPQCRLMDLESVNGTLVNGQRTGTALLKHGDVISAGESEIQYVLEPPPEELAAATDTLAEPTTIERKDDRTRLRRQQPAPDVAGYEDLVELGRGGMGVVYRATRSSTGKQCAIKVTLPDLEVSDVARQMFLREASTLAQLDHPNIVRFLEIGMAGTSLFYSMEYVPTVSLKRLLQKQSPQRRIRIICGVARQVLAALEFTHARGIVHRDIKPGNLLPAMVDGKLVVKVTDFGLAKSFEDAGFSGLTSEGELRGTLPYMSPEQIRESRFAKPSCDLYAVGVSIYHWLSGGFPYDFETVRTGLREVLDEQQQPESLGSKATDLPRELIELVDRSICRNESERWASAAEMRDALTPFVRKR